MNELFLLALLVSEEPYAKVDTTPQAVQYWGHPYRSPYRTYYPGPGYRTPYYGPRHGYWGPRWQRDPYWQFCAWRGGC